MRKQLHEYVCEMPFIYSTILEDRIEACCGAWCSVKTILNPGQSYKELYNSEEMIKLRRSVLDGTYKYCNSSCPYLAAVLDGRNTPVIRKKSTIGLQELERYKEYVDSPEHIKFCFDQTCNLHCKTCRDSLIAHPQEKSKNILDRIQEDFRDVRQIDLSGSGDPIAARSTREWLRKPLLEMFPKLNKLHIHTNAQLLTPEMWESIRPEVRAIITSIEISVDAATKETYEKIRRGGSWEKLQTNLDYLLREGNLHGITYSFVIQRDNYTEIEQFYNWVSEKVSINSKVGWNIRFSLADKWVTVSDSSFKEFSISEDSKALEDVLKQLTTLRAKIGGVRSSRIQTNITEDLVKRLKSNNSNGVGKSTDSGNKTTNTTKTSTKIQDVKNKMFCAAPWTHFHVRQQGDVHVCCMSGGDSEVLGNINEQDWRSIWEGEKFQSLRERFLRKDPETLKHCEHCVRYDSMGSYSSMHKYNEAAAKIGVNRLIASPRLMSLDLRPSNRCQLSCMICSPYNSSRWESELNVNLGCKVEGKGKGNLLELVEDSKRSIEDLSIIGGEPFIMDETYETLQTFLPFRDKIRLFFNTNCQTLVYKGQNILDVLARFPHVHIEVSLDAIGEAAEYFRYGCKWTAVTNNLEQILQVPHILVGIHPTVSALNILRLPKLLRYLEQYVDRIYINGGNMLTEPSHLDLQVLPEGLKQEVKQNLLDQCQDLRLRPDNINMVLGWIRYMEQEDRAGQFEQFKAYVAELDARRHTSFLSIVPEYEHWW